LADARLVTLPYYDYGGSRPAVVVSGPPDAPLFLSGHTDWYRSNASLVWADNGIDDDTVVYQSGVRYGPLTDGTRNDCFERFFVTVSPASTRRCRRSPIRSEGISVAESETRAVGIWFP
jgi:hypothetical protein